ncbi:MAG: ATP-grasp domain-containing protein [Fibrobacter sp.]|nr:ATP-grasp domain-containing protein [Fibrobacter sp.]
MGKKNILVFPCGSEIGLEIHRSLVNSTFFNLIGANSVEDHGKFQFETYIGGLPFYNDASFLPTLKKIIKEYKIDAIYPAMDSVIEYFKKNEKDLGCLVIAPEYQTTQICLSKSKTYNFLEGYIKTPKVYKKSDKLSFPVFVKPDVGYGSRGAKKITSSMELESHLALGQEFIISEFLPGNEYTIDCFTDKNRQLQAVKPRARGRISNGISVNTKPIKLTSEISEIASVINKKLKLRGAWFFQVKENKLGQLVLLEIACRFGGSSALYRAKGINFAQLTLFDAFGYDVGIIENGYSVEMDRALNNRYKLDLKYDEVFVDFDDCIYLEKSKINTQLIAFLYECLNQSIKVSLITKHDGDLQMKLAELRIENVFDRVIHIKRQDEKHNYIDNLNSIFIDDSFAERKAIKDKCKIPVFSVDMVEVLM